MNLSKLSVRGISCFPNSPRHSTNDYHAKEKCGHASNESDFVKINSVHTENKMTSPQPPLVVPQMTVVPKLFDMHGNQLMSYDDFANLIISQRN